MEPATYSELDQANALIARAEEVARAAGVIQLHLEQLRSQLAEKDRKIKAQQHEIQGLRDQLNLFKLAKRFQRTEPSDELKAKIDTLLQAVEHTLSELGNELGTEHIQPR